MRGNRSRLARFAAWAAIFVLFMTQAGAVAYADSEPYDESNPSFLQPDHLRAKSAILVDAKSGKVLFEKDADTQRAPASITKIMTLLLAIEYGHLDEEITVAQEVNQTPPDSSLLYVEPGEKMRFVDLLYGFFIRSGNDGAIAVANVVAGSEKAFVERMNARAQAIGCKGTHFGNSHGMPLKNHYTTARDMSLIAREAMKNETFRKIANTPSYPMPATNKRKARVLKSTNQFVVKDDPTMKNIYPYGIGIKTGYTNEAGQTLVAAAQKDGVELIAVILFSTRDKVWKWVDGARMMNYGFSAYKSYNIAEIYESNPVSVNIAGYDVDDSGGGLLTLELERPPTGLTMMDTEDNIRRITENFLNVSNITYTRDLIAPIKKGDLVGELHYTPEGGAQLTFRLLASRNVALDTDTPPTIEEVRTDAERAPLRMPKLSLIWLLLALLALLVVFGVATLRENQRLRRRKKRRPNLRRT